ncbi:MAG: hypothetical protein RI965_1851 [Bacteroidota bacterium]|jgi:hypothetical protein
MKTYFGFFIVSIILFSCLNLYGQRLNIRKEAITLLKSGILKEADEALRSNPITITNFQAERSAGGKHDFFSEGDYWWPDPQHPDGPYIQKDGLTNPYNFTAHRTAMINFSKMMGALTSAYILTNDEKYARKAFEHARAWLIDTATRMNPHMLYAQAIKGKFTGRGIGIIDMIQFMEVAQSLLKLEHSKSADKVEYKLFRNWFDQYLKWITSHPYGIDEKNAVNNHGTCWTMQVAAFAKFTGNKQLIDTCIYRYKYVHLPEQMDIDGSFPKELNRTKPFGYSLFNLDAMSMLCQILSDKYNNLWNYSTQNNKSIEKGISFITPFVKNKDSWPFKKDLMYWDQWPVAQPFLLFGANALKKDDLFNTWEKLDHAPQTDEIIRNLPVRHPLIWF